MERFNKVLIASLVLSALLIEPLVVWFILSSQQPSFQKVPFSYGDFEDYPTELVVNMSQGEFHDNHIAIASMKWDDKFPHHVFIGLKLTGFHFNPSSKWHFPNYTPPDSLIVYRLDALAVLVDSGTLRIEELSLSCRFNKSLGEEVLPLFSDPRGYNLQLIHKTGSYASPSEPFITWKSVGHDKVFFTDEFPVDFKAYNNSTSHQFIVTLTLTYSSNSSTKHQISTSLYIIIKD